VHNSVPCKDTTTFACGGEESAWPELHHFWRQYFSIGKREAQKGSHPMEPLDSCGTGIEVQSTPRRVRLDEQQVGMSANEEVRTLVHEALPNAGSVAPGAASDVGHPDGAAVALEMLMFRKVAPDELVIDVAVNSDERGDGGQCVGHPEVPNVAGMPDFIARRKVVQHAVIDVAMGVADQADAHYRQFRV